MWPWNLMDDFEQGKSEGFDSCDRPGNPTQIGFKSSIFQPVWLWNLIDDVAKYKAPLLHHIKLCGLFQIHWWIQTGVTVRKRSIRVKIGEFFVPCDLEITWITLENKRAPLLYHIPALCIISKPRVNSNWSYSPETPYLGQNQLFFLAVWPWNLTDDLEQGKSEGFESCDRPIVRNCPIWVKIGDVLSRVTLKFDGWPWKTIGHLSFAVSNFVQHFIAISEFKLELLIGNAQFGSNSTIFRAVWPWNLRYDLEKQ